MSHPKDIQRLLTTGLMALLLATHLNEVESWQTTKPLPPLQSWGTKPLFHRARTVLCSTTASSSDISGKRQEEGNASVIDTAKDSRNLIDGDTTEHTKSSTTGSTDIDSPPEAPQIQTHEFPNHTLQSPIDQLAMPWSEVQDWALRDNLPKYTIMIPIESPSTIGTKSKPKDNTIVFALWRTMLKEVPELAGYPIEFLQEVHSHQISSNRTTMQVTPQLLPYLEDYTFVPAGGVSGKVYGVPGLADGTIIQTSAVSSIEVTLPQGFVRTLDGKAAYELGRPQREDYSFSINNNKLQPATMAIGSAATSSYELLRSVEGVSPSVVEDADGMLLRLGATTGILLAGATAINMLSHHLTVNVFWV